MRKTLLSSLLVAFPTGDLQGKMTARHKPVALATQLGLMMAGEKRSETQPGAL